MCEYCDGVCICDEDWYEYEPSAQELTQVEQDTYEDTLAPFLDEYTPDDDL
jgi:hypothetical protein